MFGIGLPEIFIIFVLFSIILLPVWLMGKILAKAGFSAWFSLISFVPVANVIALWIFAFISWPNSDQQG